MELSVKELYWKVANELRCSGEMDDVYLTIKGLCFLHIMNEKGEIDINDLKLVDHKEFNRVIEREAFKLDNSKHQLQETLINIVKSRMFEYGDEVDKAYRFISNLNIDASRQLFNYDDYSRGMRGLECLTQGEIADLCCRLTNAQTASNVLDLCSGEGVFLARAGYNPNPEARLTGYEIRFTSKLISDMRLLIDGRNFTIYEKDVLTTKIEGKYDVVFSEIPNSLKVDKENPITEKDDLVVYNGSKHRADWAFIVKAINSINENGIVAIVSPIGVLFNMPDKNIREQVVEKGLLKSVISLPGGSVYRSMVSFCVMLFSKNNKTTTFIDASECFKKEGRNKILDVDAVMNIIENKDSRLYRDIETREIAKNDYNLSLSNYFNSVEELNLVNPHALSELAEILPGYQYLKSNTEEFGPKVGEIDVVKLSNIENGEIDYGNLSTINAKSDKIAKFYLQENDILITSKGTGIKVAMYKDQKRKVVPFNNLLVVRITNNKINPIYVCSFLSGETGKKELQALQSGLAIMNLPIESVKKVQIPVIDMDTQDTIANRYLRIKKELVEAQNKINSLNEKLNTLYEDEVGD